MHSFIRVPLLSAMLIIIVGFSPSILFVKSFHVGGYLNERLVFLNVSQLAVGLLAPKNWNVERIWSKVSGKISSTAV